jgi:RimJ/RimL family protein N-acetyltransferase
MPGVTLETARLRLRAFHDDDLGELVALADDWAVAQWLSPIFPHPYTEPAGRFWIAHVRRLHETDSPGSFALARKADDRLIGGIGLDGSAGDDSAEVALGYWLGRPHWRLGYAREAVAALIDYGLFQLGLASIRAYTDPANVASQRVLLACGLTPQGEIALTQPTRHGATRAPLFRIEHSQP